MESLLKGNLITWGALATTGPNPFLVTRTCPACWGRAITTRFMPAGLVIVVDVAPLDTTAYVSVWVFGTIRTWPVGMMIWFWRSGAGAGGVSSSSSRSTTSMTLFAPLLLLVWTMLLVATPFVMGWKKRTEISTICGKGLSRQKCDTIHLNNWRDMYKLRFMRKKSFAVIPKLGMTIK